jgi:hypothetical protein
MASVLVKWKPGKGGLYQSHTMGKDDWKGLGFEDEADVAPVVFDRGNNFTVVGDKLPPVQRDFFENNADYEVKDFGTNEVTMSKAAAINAQAIGAEAPRTVTFDEPASEAPAEAPAEEPAPTSDEAGESPEAGTDPTASAENAPRTNRSGKNTASA